MDLEKISNEIAELINSITCLGQPNWLDYIQVTASIISIIISALAVVMAVRIPKKIADKQDKIALFNKRFDSFSSFQKCQAFADLLKTMEDIDGYKISALHFLGDGENWAYETKNVKINLIQTSVKLQQLAFLFDNVDYKDVVMVFVSLKDFVFSLESTDNVEVLKDKFISSIDMFAEKYEKMFLYALKIN